MDTSEKYIKMCEKAKKDLGWQPSEGDFYYDKGGTWAKKNYSSQPGINTLTLNDAMSLCFDGHYDKAIPIYRQDQLQEMIDDLLKYEITLIKHRPWFQNTVYGSLMVYTRPDYTWGCEVLGSSMEQLWLAFVMKEKYGKIWDDKKEEWRKE